MNFSGVSLHSPEIGVCQPKVYGDIQSHQRLKGIKQYAISLLQEDCQKIQHLNWLSKQTCSNIKRQERVCVALS